MDEVTIYCYHQTSKTIKKILSELIKNKSINILSKTFVRDNLKYLSIKYEYLEIVNWVHENEDLEISK